MEQGRRFWLLFALALAGCRSGSELTGVSAARGQNPATSADERSASLALPIEAKPSPEVTGPTLLAPVEPLTLKQLPSPNTPGGVSPAAQWLARLPEASDEKDVRLLTLHDALATGLLQNPDLQTLRGQININEGMVGVAKTYPWNPFVQAQYFPNGRPYLPAPPGFAAGQSNFYVWTMQRFELAHQRSFRIQGAVAGLNQVQWNIYQGELLNVAQSMRLYLTLLYQKELYDLAVATADLNERLAHVVELRYKANAAKVGDLTTARIAARQVQRQLELATVNYKTALLNIHQQLNIPVSTSLDIRQKLESFRWLPIESIPEESAAAQASPGNTPQIGPRGTSGNLAADLIEGRPDVMAAQAGIRVAQASYQLARAAQMPDLSAGPIYETADDGTRYIGVRFQTDIPIWNTGRPLARQRRAEMSQQQLTYDQLKLRATREAESAINRYERARRLVNDMLRDRALRPEGAYDELKGMVLQFQAGQADVLNVLTTQTNLLNERRVFLDMLNEVAQAAANVVQATALPPHRVVDVAPR